VSDLQPLLGAVTVVFLSLPLMIMDVAAFPT
jgi:hypothetical protein